MSGRAPDAGAPWTSLAPEGGWERFAAPFGLLEQTPADAMSEPG